MRLHRYVLTLLTLPCLLISSLSLAVGLGDLKSGTGIGQPLIASIPIMMGDARVELNELHAEIAASPTAEQSAAGQYSGEHYRFTVKVVEAVETTGGSDKASAATYQIIISSKRPIVEPYVTLPIQLIWPGGSLHREYTVLLD